MQPDITLNQGSNNNKKYKAYFVGENDQQKKEFKNEKCALLISVGQQNHENEKFNAAIKLTGKSFSFCNILVGDTLQRHTLGIFNQDKSEDELYVLAKNAGDKWIERNMKYISTLAIPYKISRWDEWINHNKYQYYYKKVYELYNNNKEYRNIVDKMVYEFLSRKNHFNVQNDKVEFNLCTQYLLEESAVTCLLIEDGYKFYAYPSNLSMITACTKLVFDNSVKARSLKFRFGKVNDRIINDYQAENHKYIAANYLLNHAPGHIYWKNLEGRYLGCNIEHAKYCGFDDSNDIIGKTDEELFGKDTAISIAEADAKVLTTGKEHVVEEFDKGKYFLSKKVPLRDENNKIIGLLGTSINITEQKKLKLNLEKTTQELERALEAKTEFLNNMSHEMRTPMLGFTSISEGLVENWESLSNEKRLKYVKDIANSAQRLESLISNILDLSTLVTNKTYMNFVKVDFNKLIEEVITETKTLYGNNKAFNIKFLPAKNITVKVDKEWMTQALRHLFSNAVKFNSENGLITIALTETDNYLNFSITDSGVGIPEHEIQEIFNLFTLSSRTKTKAGGRGLGLAICKEIIEAHHGKIWAQNNDSQQGATFHFTIPLKVN